MKKKIIIIVTILSAISLLFIFIKTKKTTEDISTIGVVKPNIPNYIDYKGELNLTFDKSKFDFPSKLPMLKIVRDNSVDQEEALKIAKNYGLGENFSTFEDSEFGKTYIWNQKEIGSLIVYTKSNNIVFTPTINSNTEVFSKTPEDIRNIAINYLREKNLLDMPEKTVVNVYGLSTKDESSNIVGIEKAVVFKVTISLNVNGFSVVTTNPYQSHFSVYIDTNGRVIKVEYTKNLSIVTTEQEYPIKNYEDFVKSISEAKIVSIDDGKILPQDVKDGEIEKIDIKNIKISYLEDSYKTELLQPVFVLDSEITLRKNNYSGILYLSAFK